MDKLGLENNLITNEDLFKKLSGLGDDDFKTVRLFNSYFKSYREVTINNLNPSERRDEDIGVISYLGLLITKINQIQEKRDEG